MKKQTSSALLYCLALAGFVGCILAFVLMDDYIGENEQSYASIIISYISSFVAIWIISYLVSAIYMVCMGYEFSFLKLFSRAVPVFMLLLLFRNEILEVKHTGDVGDKRIVEVINRVGITNIIGGRA